ncbi:MAG: hypothetical protein AAFU61_17730, partial [Pseudomonadota bacterium]
SLPQVHGAPATGLSLVLGTSLAVQPLAGLAQALPRVAIINVERTRTATAEAKCQVRARVAPIGRPRPHRVRASQATGVRVHEPCDQVLGAVLRVLGIDAPPPPDRPQPPLFMAPGEASVDLVRVVTGERRVGKKRPRDRS